MRDHYDSDESVRTVRDWNSLLEQRLFIVQRVGIMAALYFNKILTHYQLPTVRLDAPARRMATAECALEPYVPFSLVLPTSSRQY